MDTLKELYIDQLQDLWSANKQAYRMTKEFCNVASDEELRETLERSCDRIEEHNERLAELIESYDASPSDEHCKGMEGLVKEARSHILEEEFGDNDVRDAQIIAQYQRMTHYGIAVYGTCRALAEQLGCKDDARTLADDLENVKEGDVVMNRIAEESINQRAA